jgi:4-hydroxythreonine-4-phosphate dehydrogenase
MGDPSGIGPEVLVKALSDKRVSQVAHITVIGDYFVINMVKKDLRSKVEISLLDLSNVPQNNFSYGKHDPSFGKAAMEYVDKAADMLKKGEADALVTAPLNKSSVRAASFNDFEGHTEYLAAKTGAKEFAMMFVGKDLKIALVTRHIALKDVARSLSTEGVYKTIKLTAECLKSCFRIEDPKIGVAGLNPHAGDNGLFGDEEARVIMPAVKKALAELKNIYGPIAPDAIFYEALSGKFDAVVAMYHDQALAPFKMLHFKDGVNLTIGLPFIRTSPDHGTAFDIAGKGVADPTSMKEAIILASCLARP